jgi:hypothetical protein
LRKPDAIEKLKQHFKWWKKKERNINKWMSYNPYFFLFFLFFFLFFLV